MVQMFYGIIILKFVIFISTSGFTINEQQLQGTFRITQT